MPLKMNNLKFLAYAALVLSLTQAQAYYSHDSYEGTVTFIGFLEVDKGLPDSEIVRYAHDQMLYLAGPLQGAEKKSGPKRDQQIQLLDKFTDSQGRYMARYQYTGTLVLANSIQNTVAIRLPYNHTTIYKASNERCYSEGPGHIAAYFWNPLEKGCNLAEGKDYFTALANIVRKPNTTKTMPAYERLVNNNNEIRAVVVFGADDNAKGMNPPENAKDFNSEEYVKTRSYLLSQGFSRKTIPQNVREQECGKSVAAAPGFVEELTRQDHGRRIVIRLFWGVASIFDESSAYYCMIKEAVEKSSIYLYSGHSRLGDVTFDYVKQILNQPVRVNRDQYQIFGFFGCSSYSYYNLSYFAEKITPQDPTGTMNADIITNGVAGSFYSMADFNIKTLEPILNWSKNGSKSSWQQIIQSYPEAYLTGVNGDE